MPGARTRFRPPPASETSASDEASKLELHLQRQLEEDVARIFDESIYSDLEVVCGKLKILTHSCILKARTKKFYHKLETILHVNIGRKTFDEIYSFISDAYTECNIKHQEKEIITYLDDNLNIVKSIPRNPWSTKEDNEESEVFLTPKCISPYIEKRSIGNGITSSPSTELTKEYYALVPIEGNLLDKELIEQDVLSNAFHSIIKTQSDDLSKVKVTQRNKPTSLSLSSSHTSKTVRHSNSCDILIKCHLKDNIVTDFEKSNEKKLSVVTSQSIKINQVFQTSNIPEHIFKNINGEQALEKVIDTAYSPDSLITDDPSSSSDYLSAAYTCSPGISASGCLPQLNVGENITKMENIFTSSDSGLENTAMLESLTSHKDVTLTDVSLTESTLHDLTTDEASNSHDSVSSPVSDKNQFQRLKNATTSQTFLTGSSSEMDYNGQIPNQTNKFKDIVSSKSSKEEKQRQNEEIVILESSSLSSETGSWESVFPPKLAEKEVCEKFINSERRHFNSEEAPDRNKDSTQYSELCPSLVQKSPFKSTSCFIDAASLVDEEDDTIKIHTETGEVLNVNSDVLPAPSRPLPCSTVKLDISPNDWSESNENEDSLEQGDKHDPDSIQKDLSPTIFEMTPITEDSLCTNAFEVAAQAEQESKKAIDIDDASSTTNERESLSSSTLFMSSTPHNSIMSLKASTLKQYESEESESDTTIVGREGHINVTKLKKYNEASPIISGGASIEDHLPQIGSHIGSPLARRKIENIPIVSGAYIPQAVEQSYQKKSPKPSSASAWVVDMSSSPKSDGERSASSVSNISTKKPGDKMCENLRNGSKYSSSLENCNKSRSSVDSDSSERSSHKFYIDLSRLPDPLPPISNAVPETVNEKKNIFSMYIDLGDKPTKEMPARLSSSLNTKKTSNEVKPSPKNCKSTKSSSEFHSLTISQSNDPNTSTSIFEKYESLCNDPNISISEIIGYPEKHKTPDKVVSDAECKKEKVSRGPGDRSFHRNMTTVIQEEPADQSADLFVKLSDLDKPVHKIDTPVIIHEEKVLDVRMTRSIPDNNWGDQHSGASRSIEVISSFHSENALSLNRLFPHLKNEFSRSMPGSLSGRTRSPLRIGMSSSPGDLDEQASDVSELSSVQSSICRSVVENSTTEETSQTSSLIGNCQSRLGQDLLRMFLEEIAPDVIVEVSGRRIKAHKCILSSRCQYFAGILSGGWVESAGNIIVLPPFSFNVVHFALCHIYSGVSTIPDSISIVELATIADMLGLEGLKEAIMFTLKAKYCHHFHKPCPVCTAGVLECFPLSSVYGLDDLYRKCLRWITKHFSKVWPTKAFATLPSELLDKCYQQHVINLTTDNLVDTVYGCGITVASLQNSRWAESVARMCRRLVNAAAHFAAPRLVSVLQAIVPLPSDAPHPAKQALDDCLAAAIEWAPPDEACRAYAFLSSLVKDLRTQHYAKPDLIANGNQTKVPNPNSLLFTHASSWRLQCEGALVRAAPRVVGTQAFKDLPSDLRKRLRELGCIMYGAQAILNTMINTSPLQDRKSRSTYHAKTPKAQNTATTRSLDIDHVRNSFVPYAPKPTAQVGSVDILKSNNDLRDRKSHKLNPPKVRTTKAQEERAKFNLSKTNQSQDRLNSKGSGRISSFENTKPRYLEPRMCKEPDKGDRKPTAKKLANKMVSSSESSRNSSPIQARNLRTSRMKSRAEAQAQAMSQDSLATSSRPRTAEPSTDSLSESQTSNKYATYTKTKHTSKGSIESIKTKCQTVPLSALNNKVKTKIPVYLNQGAKTNENKFTNERRTQPSKTGSTATNNSAAARKNDRKVPGSLMNATKSSSAKMVPKIVKETKASSKQKTTKHRQNEHELTDTIPVMERSGTFLKDEPTFGDKTTSIDIDQ